MEIEVIKIEYLGSTRTKDETTMVQDVKVISGIIGNPYPEFRATDFFQIEFPNEGLDVKGIMNFISEEVSVLINNKYPNTNG